MKRAHLVLIIATVTLAAAATLSAQRKTGPLKDQYERATDLAALHARIARLEGRIANLEAELRQLRAERDMIPRVPDVPRPLPPGWQKRQFNGLDYYLIPCDPPMPSPKTQPAR